MRIVFDLNRCQGLAQCVPLAPDFIKLNGEEAIAYDPNPDDAQPTGSARRGVLPAAGDPRGPLGRIGEYDKAMNDPNSDAFKAKGRTVIVGASLAGLRCAEALLEEGFTGHLTVIGDEPHEPYDRPPLSKQVLKGWVPAEHTKLPRMREVNAEWRLGVAATGIDRAKRVVRLANGDEVPGDCLLIATGVRARQWPNPAEAKLEGVFTLRTSTDAGRLQAALAAQPRRVLIIGAGSSVQRWPRSAANWVWR